MISHTKSVKQIFPCAKTINNTILNILLLNIVNNIQQCIQDLKMKYMLNLISFDKTSEMLFHLLVQSLQT